MTQCGLRRETRASPPPRSGRNVHHLWCIIKSFFAQFQEDVESAACVWEHNPRWRSQHGPSECIAFSNCRIGDQIVKDLNQVRMCCSFVATQNSRNSGSRILLQACEERGIFRMRKFNCGVWWREIRDLGFFFPLEVSDKALEIRLLTLAAILLGQRQTDVKSRLHLPTFKKAKRRSRACLCNRDYISLRA